MKKLYDCYIWWLRHFVFRGQFDILPVNTLDRKQGGIMTLCVLALVLVILMFIGIVVI